MDLGEVFVQDSALAYDFDIAFTFYGQPSVEQVSGAAALGISFPLDNN